MRGQAQPYPSMYELGAPVDLLHLSEPKSSNTIHRLEN